MDETGNPEDAALSSLSDGGPDWIVQCFTSPPTQYRLYVRRFLQVKRPNQQYQSTEGDATKDKTNNENNKIHICTDNNIHKISTTSPLVYTNMG